MVIPSVNFLSYNSTGLDSIKADYIRNLYNVTKCDFISIQEHFKKTKSIDKFFKDNFPENTSYVIPGVREKDQDSGRPKGGIAQLRNKKLDIKVDRIEEEKASEFKHRFCNFKIQDFYGLIHTFLQILV